MDMADRRVLSIQSHVVHGYVGNKSATFPLQVLGFEVDAINSVQFSNHTGYKGGAKGQILNSDELGTLFDGLKTNDLNHYSHLLTGYIGSESFLLKVKEVINDLKTSNPELIYVCDPVMGDHGKMYVPAELMPVYRDQIIPLADIVTPNQYEAELLTGIKIDSLVSAKAAMQKLHEMGAKTVVISSSDLGSEEVLVGLGSSCKNGMNSSIKIEMPKLPANFTGTGDLFTSLLLANLSEYPDNLQAACEKTVSTMQHVLQKTLSCARDAAGPGNKPTKAQLELKLIQSKAIIENPELVIKASPL